MPWQRDFLEIDLTKVPDQGVDPSQNPHGYSREDLLVMADNLKKIQRLSHEKGYHHEDFRRLRTSTDPAERALGETHHKFYDHDQAGAQANTDFVKVEWSRDHYEVTNGRHRLWAAQQRGLTHLPAQVSAPDAATLARLRAESDRISAGRRPLPDRAAPWERTRPTSAERPANRERT